MRNEGGRALLVLLFIKQILKKKTIINKFYAWVFNFDKSDFIFSLLFLLLFWVDIFGGCVGTESCRKNFGFGGL